VTAPAAVPTVTSAAYPADGRWHGGAAVPGEFTFGANGVTDVDHYVYGWGVDSPSTPVAADALGGAATVALTPPGDGPSDLYVQSVDRAGNRSRPAIHHIYVRPGNGPLAQWSFEGDAKDTAYLGWRDAGLLGGATYAAGAVGTGVSLDGSSGRVAVQNGTRTDASFSVSAWARINKLDVTSATVVSQSGANNVGFSIQYESWNDRYVFVLPQTDVTNSPADFVRAPVRPVVGEWTHVAGVYDAAQKRISFYVNGVLAGSAPHNPTWSANGYFRVGYHESGGTFAGFFPGMIDEVKLYDRPLSAAEVRAQVGTDNVQTGYWKFDDDQTSRTAVNAVPGGAAGVLGGGASFVPGPVAGAVSLGGIDDHVTMSGPIVRTDQSFTVAGWLTPDRVPTSGNTHTAISQDGAVNSGFFLG